VVEGELTVTRGIERHDQRARNGVRAGWTSIMPCSNASLLVVLPASGEWIITLVMGREPLHNIKTTSHAGKNTRSDGVIVNRAVNRTQ
jgi:hypothetical protein